MVSRQTEERRARNEASFRAANSKIADAAEHLRTSGDPIPFLCECGDRACFEIVPLSAADYQEVRGDPRWFLHHPRHDPTADETEKLVERRDSHLIMEKVGHAAEIAEQDAGRG